jgi:hypothetical protein
MAPVQQGEHVSLCLTVPLHQAYLLRLIGYTEGYSPQIAHESPHVFTRFSHRDVQVDF